jgi:hypothetical protein
MDQPWTERATALVRSARSSARAPGWGYRHDTEPATEPTVLAGLALLATGSDQRQAVQEAARWLVSLQQPDGSVGISASIRAPGWPTPLAVLLWSALQDQVPARRRAVQWLLQRRGKTYEKTADSPLGHDPTIAAWPWVTGTHSWLEPTVMAMLALGTSEHRTHSRMSDGLRYIHDRTIDSSGWNYGNTVVFGTTLRAQPGPTGLALLALSLLEKQPSARVEQGIRYLQTTLPLIGSAVSLCWGLLGLLAWNRPLAGSDRLLEQSFSTARTRPDRAYHAAHALLAAGGQRSLRLLGLEG